MEGTVKRTRLCLIVTLCLAAAGARASDAPATRRFRLEAELGPSWQSRNDVRIPGDGGTLLALDEFDKGPFFFERVSAWYRFNDRHALRALYAPFEVTVSGTPATDVAFDGEIFPGGEPLDATYQFHSYRLAYLYTPRPRGRWEVTFGFSAKVRDARVALAAASRTHEYNNVGFVPLLLARVEVRLSPRLSGLLDVEALAAPQGRAEDATLQLRYRVSDGMDVGAGYRMVEGGADNDKILTFAWLHYLLVSAGVDF
jgi:hypothetical protein